MKVTYRDFSETKIYYRCKALNVRVSKHPTVLKITIGFVIISIYDIVKANEP